MPSEPCSRELFTCRMCGDCCRGYGGTFVSPDDIRTIAAYLAVEAERFVENYCQFSGGRPVLAQAHSGYCVFWDGKCSIHPVKPRMCRQWPYLPSVLVDVGNWHAMARSCPGMRTDADDRVIRACVARSLGPEGQAVSSVSGRRPAPATGRRGPGGTRGLPGPGRCR